MARARGVDRWKTGYPCLYPTSDPVWKEALGQVSFWLGEEAAEASSDESSHPKLWDILEEGALFQNTFELNLKATEERWGFL